MTMWTQNNESSVIKREIQRLILMAEKNGICTDAIGISEAKIEELLSLPFCEDKGIPPQDMATFVYKAKDYWFNKGMAIIVDGGGFNDRELFVDICLYRFLVYGSIMPDNVIISYRMSEIITKLSTFENKRFDFTTQLSRIPCLAIREVDIKESPRTTNDCLPLLDSILFHRIKHGKPTIISLCVNKDAFNTPYVFGKAFSQLIQSGNNEKVYNIRVKEHE